MSQDLYLHAKLKNGRMVSECPECGKEVIINDVAQVSYCSLMCETNYRYRMKNRDIYGNMTKSSEDVKKWQS
jgi:hypothetical protein